LQDFEEEKRKEIERDAPKEEDNTLPGWVSHIVSSLSTTTPVLTRLNVIGIVVW